MEEMLKTINAESLDQLTQQTVPESINLSDKAKEEQAKILGGPVSEYSALNYLKEVAAKNKIFKNYIGCGYNPVIVPPVILRNVLENPSWYTSYTPYQAEISQGRLQSLLNYQTLITELTGLPFSNASLLDEATSAAEAMYMAYNLHNGRRKDFFVSSNLFPFIKDVIKSRAHYIGINIIEGDYKNENLLNNPDLFGAIVQNPDNHGRVVDYSEFTQKMKKNEVVSIMAADIASLLMIKSPGEMGFDIAVGSAQRFGVPMMNGGPHAGFLASRDEYKRKIPGRVVGISKDSNENRALRLAMQTREQHIRRDKATSNICTAQALLANMSAFYSLFHGKQGLIEISQRYHLYATYLHKQLTTSFRYALVNNVEEIFDTITIDLAKSNLKKENVVAEFEKNHINIREIDENFVSVTINETTTLVDLEDIINIFAKLKERNSVDLTKDSLIKEYDQTKLSLCHSLRRDTSGILNEDIFNKYSSESQILRYIYYLQSKDVSLCNSMISLGSCTMKLNATSELVNININSHLRFQLHGQNSLKFIHSVKSIKEKDMNN
jgi:glycine dehydrogenase